MNVRKRVEDHPLVVYMGLVVAAVTATLGIALPLAQTAHDTEVQNLRLEAQGQIEQARQEGQDQLVKLQDRVVELNGQIGALRGQVTDLIAERTALEQSLSGVQRSLGGESDEIDVSHLVVNREGAKSLPASSLFFPEDSFYALNAADAAGWTYELTDELHLLASQGGVTDEEEARLITASGGKVENVKLWPVHLWRRPGSVSIEGFPNVRVLHTQVFLQRAPIDGFLKLEGLSDAAVAAHRDDALLLLLTTELFGEAQQGGQFLSGLETIQQRGSTIYARFESVLREVTVNGDKLPEYYWTRELMIVETADSFYLVKTFLPNRDHRSPDFAHLTEWFQAFAVLADG